MVSIACFRDPHRYSARIGSPGPRFFCMPFCTYLLYAYDDSLLNYFLIPEVLRLSQRSLRGQSLSLTLEA